MFLERGDRDKSNETGLKEGGGIEMSTTVLSIYVMHALSFAFCIYLPVTPRSTDPGGGTLGLKEMLPACPDSPFISLRIF